MELLEIISLNWPAAICLLAGFILVTIELFTPGFGVPGISGLALLTLGIVLTWIHYGVAAGLSVTLISLALAGISISISIKSAANGKIARSALFLKSVTPPADDEENKAFEGREGVTATALRPIGVAEFDGVRLNVVTEGEFIDRGATVRVIRVEGGRIIVRAVRQA